MKRKKYIFKNFLMISIIGIGLFNFAKIHASIPTFSKSQGFTDATPATSYNFTTDLIVGSKGEDVRNLQNFLIEQGYTILGGATEYFGVSTKTALIKFQKANNLNPNGVFKAKTRAKVNSMMAVTPAGLSVGSTSTAGFDPVIGVPTDALKREGVLKATTTNNKIGLQATDGDIQIERIKVDFKKNEVSIRYVDADGFISTIDVETTIPTDSDNFEIVIGKTTIEFDKNDIKENIYLNNDLDIIIKKDEVQEFSIKSLVVTTTTDAALGTAGHDSTNSLETKTYTVKQKTPPLNKSEEDFSTVIAAGSAQKITDPTGKAFEDLPIIPTATALATGVFIVAGSIIGDTTITYTPNKDFDPKKAYEINTTDGEGIYYRTQNSSGGYDYFATDIHGGNTVQITFSDSALNGVANLTGWVKVQ